MGSMMHLSSGLLPCRQQLPALELGLGNLLLSTNALSQLFIVDVDRVFSVLRL